ncbi:MAG TPA: MlaD family protein [Gemmatimonadaceae bacterium]|nr:MlaD family protein [Gemmatimonadaceae bacterium]
MLAFLGGAALVLATLVALARYPSLFRRGQEYRAIFGSVTGISLGDEVRYGGLLVGSITALELAPNDPSRIEVRFRVRRDTPMHADMKATITQVGLLGQPFLNLTPGTAAAPRLQPGDIVPSQDNLGFQDAMSRLALFLDRADTLLQGAERIVGTSSWERLDRTLARFDTLISNASRGSDRVFTDLEVASRRLIEVLDRTEVVIQGIDTTVRQARPDLASTQREALATLRDMRALTSSLRDAIERGDRVEEIIRNMSVASENMARLTERLERDPSTLLRRREAPSKPAGPRP